MDEPYILKPRSTFGATKITDCQKIIIPKNMLLVMGDNRKGSLDSRELFLISEKSVDKYLEYASQKKYSINWRDTKNDKYYVNKSMFNQEKYVDFLNSERISKGLKPLKINQKLNISAELRAKAMLKFDDLSWEATKSGYTMQKSMEEAGYTNITYGEYPALGYYDTDEMIKMVSEKKDFLNFFMNKDYQDIGIGTFIGQLHDCPVQIVVQQVAGYVPPNYSKEDIESWEKSLSALRNVQTGWSSLKENKYFYEKNKQDVDRINEIIAIRIQNTESILSSMNANKWLNQSQNSYINQDNNLYKEQESLATKLNNINY